MSFFNGTFLNKTFLIQTVNFILFTFIYISINYVYASSNIGPRTSYTFDSTTTPPTSTANSIIQYLLQPNPSFNLDEGQTQCRKAYNYLYSTDEIKISIFWGYLDFETETHDQVFKNQSLAALTTPCDFSQYQFACGFEFDTNDKNSLIKNIREFDGKNRKILIKVSSSSYSNKISINEKDKVGRKRQQILTENQWKSFEKSLQEDTVVFYIGHARYGSGPSFGPLDPYTYEAVKDTLLKPNLKRMVKALSQAASPPKILGLITCQAKNYYAKVINSVSPMSSLILTNQSTAFADNLGTVLSSLESLFSMKCQEGFRNSFIENTSFYSTHKYDTLTYEDKLTTISGFFDKHVVYKEPAKLSPFLLISEYLVPAPSKENLREVVNKNPSLLLSIPYLRHN